MKFERKNTIEEAEVYERMVFKKTDSEIRNPDGSIVFSAKNIEIPEGWSQVAADVLAQKYFRKQGVPQYDKNGMQLFNDNGTPIIGSEYSLKQVVHRLAGCWTFWGKKGHLLCSSCLDEIDKKEKNLQ